MGKIVLPKILERFEVEKLLEQPSQKSKTGIRNRAILRLIINTGLRVSEIVNLQKRNVDLPGEMLRVVNGKGGKDRDVPILPEAIPYLEKWEKLRPEEFLYFVSYKNNPLKAQYLDQMIKRYAKKAGIQKRVYCHLLRHTYATEYYRQTKDIGALRLILGHSDISTTQIYVTLSNEDIKKATKGVVGF